jgi:hypothetical protein
MAIPLQCLRYTCPVTNLNNGDSSASVARWLTLYNWTFICIVAQINLKKIPWHGPQGKRRLLLRIRVYSSVASNVHGADPHKNTSCNACYIAACVYCERCTALGLHALMHCLNLIVYKFNVFRVKRKLQHLHKLELVFIYKFCYRFHADTLYICTPGAAAVNANCLRWNSIISVRKRELRARLQMPHITLRICFHDATFIAEPLQLLLNVLCVMHVVYSILSRLIRR